MPIEIEPVNLSPGLQLTLGTRQFVRMSESSRKDFRNKLAAGLSAILASSECESIQAAPLNPATSLRTTPAILKARLAGMTAALITLLWILVVA